MEEGHGLRVEAAHWTSHQSGREQADDMASKGGDGMPTDRGGGSGSIYHNHGGTPTHPDGPVAGRVRPRTRCRKGKDGQGSQTSERVHRLIHGHVPVRITRARPLIGRTLYRGACTSHRFQLKRLFPLQREGARFYYDWQPDRDRTRQPMAEAIAGAGANASRIPCLWQPFTHGDARARRTLLWKPDIHDMRLSQIECNRAASAGERTPYFGGKIDGEEYFGRKNSIHGPFGALYTSQMGDREP